MQSVLCMQENQYFLRASDSWSQVRHMSGSRVLKQDTSGITVGLDTVVSGAIGFMRIRNKSGGTLVNPDFHSPSTWS